MPGSTPGGPTRQQQHSNLTVVQRIEQQPSKLWVAGSIPAGQAIHLRHSSYSSKGEHSVQTSKPYGPVGSIQTLVPQLVALAACGSVDLRSCLRVCSVQVDHPLACSMRERGREREISEEP